MKLSKNVRHGDICTIRAGKVIKASRGRRIAGVWESGRSITVMLLDGTRRYLNVPSGLIVRGQVEVHYASKD